MFFFYVFKIGNLCTFVLIKKNMFVATSASAECIVFQLTSFVLGRATILNRLFKPLNIKILHNI